MSQSPERVGGPSFVVGIGASAGGLEALEELFERMPADVGMAFVVVQHLSPDFESVMDELLARRTVLPVHRVENGMPLEANRVYLIPPRNDMIVSDGRLLLSDKGDERELSLPIDIFFRSLASDAGPRGIAVVLSGTGTDGSRGIRAVSEAGGLVLAQSPSDAAFDGMPKAARDTGCVDVLLPAADIAAALGRYRRRMAIGGDRRELARGSDPVHGILETLRATTGLDFEHYKPATVTRRIERRVVLHQDADLDEYAARIVDDRSEVDALYRDLLIGVTRFFRDTEAFDRLEADVLPAVIGKLDEGRELRAWVAGCATGEEAYTLAMLVREQLEAAGRPVEAKIFATDVHQTSLDFASEGVYSEQALEGLSAERRQRWFTRAGDRFRVASELRQMVVFARHDVIRDAPFTRLDLLTCRNLLIYLRPEAQQKALSLFHFGLKPNGTLFLGTSETLGPLAEEFDVIDERWRLFRKRRDARLPGSGHLSRPSHEERAWSRTSTRAPHSVKRLLSSYDTLLSRYMPAALLISHDREILHVFGGASRYLRVSEGRPSHDLLDVLDRDLKLPITGAIQRVRSQGEPVVFSGVKIGDERLRLRVEPVAAGDGPSDLLIVFDTDPRPSIVEAPSAELDLDEISREQLSDLERELEHTKESLQATIEELETSNEELQATNEELVASNEELQSTNEELQSVNEELYTVNAELQKKIQQLTELTNDMDNLLAATDVGTIFVDSDLRIRKFTPRITELFDLVPEDVGRPLGAFTHSIEHDALIDAAHAVLAGGPPHEREVQDRAGRWYFLRILPYETATETEGVVLTVVDLTALKRAERELFRARYLLDSLMDTLPDNVYFADRRGRFVRMNRSFAARLGLRSPKAAEGRRLSEIAPGPMADDWEATDARIRETGHPVINQLEQIERDGACDWSLTTKIALRDEDDNVVGTFGVSRDVTRQKRAEDHAREAVERRDAFLAILSHELRNPLGAIMNASHVLEGDDEPLDVIRRQANHMARLLDDLLEVSRVTQDKIELRTERLDLRDVADESVRLLRQRSDEARVLVELAIPDAPVEVDGDASRLKQILTNLLTNALKYNESGGHVWLTIEREAAQAVVRVRDDGLGMEPEMLERVFEMFVQGDGSLERSDGGMGLGLALVRSLVLRHGGTVHAESEGPGQGSQFVVRLPSANGAAPEPAEPKKRAPIGGGVVVIVEDQADNREMLRLLLEQRGYEVVEAADGRSGLETILEVRPAAAVVDIGLPELDGYELARRVRDRLGSDVRLIALTGYGTAGDRDRARTVGFDDHLVKPVTIAALTGALGG